MPTVVVAIAVQAHAGFAVLEQETTEIARERLDADADFVEVETFVERAQIFQVKQFLHADEAVVARLAEAWIDLHCASNCCTSTRL